MRAIAEFFLRAKHWQIFLLLAALFLMAQVSSLLIDLVAHRQAVLTVRAAFLYSIVIVLLLLLPYCFLGWFASVGFFPCIDLPVRTEAETGFFRFALLYPAVYLPLSALALHFLSTDTPFIFVIFPLHTLAGWCLFHNFYFVAKSVILAESRKPATFTKYAVPFFLLWFFPIGIWIIQPKVNRLYAERVSTSTIVTTTVA